MNNKESDVIGGDGNVIIVRINRSDSSLFFGRDSERKGTPLLITQVTVQVEIWLPMAAIDANVRVQSTVCSESHCAAPGCSISYRDRQHMLHDLKTAITAYIRNISQADLQKVFANKIKWVQTRIRRSWGHVVAQLVEALRYNLKVAGSIPGGVTGIFH
jgi:hypothetical protein